MIWDFSVIQQKDFLTCPVFYGLIFKSLHHTSLISPRWEIDETVNFQNLCKLLTNKFAAFFFFGILAPHFQTGKAKRIGRVHEACCNGRHLDIGEINVATRRS